MSKFDDEYKKLNQAQKEAVDTVYGPVLVVAGPGTGKTQLLSMRVANILRQSDVAARNILCLTFTDSAAKAMRERLLGLIGVDAHKVAIHTFHSFCVEVINQYPQYFYRGARFLPADEVFQVELLREILSRLEHDNPLTSKMNDKFVYLRSLNQAIGYLKKAGLHPADLRALLESNHQVIEQAEPVLSEAFGVARLSKSRLPAIKKAVRKLPEPAASKLDLPAPFGSLLTLLKESLTAALDEAEAEKSTKPVTAWKGRWLEKDRHNRYVLRDRGRNQRLQALAEVYESYQEELRARERYDFADMVLQVLTALDEHPELRYQLQEQYQFLLVDEFQDSNDGQIRLLRLLMDNPVHEDRPDIMVVGDDDQAIYKFQGAEVSNILDFYKLYPGVKVVTLRQNYRSRQEILDLARSLITQGEVRLETVLPGVDKTLKAANPSLDKVRIKIRQLETPEQEYAWVAKEIKQLIKAGTSPGEIAVIGRQHNHLEALMPHLRQLEVPVAYERRQNVLEEHHIKQLIDTARTVQALSDSDFTEANRLLSQVLSYPFWGVEPVVWWRLSLQAYRQRQDWLEVMQESKDERLRKIAGFFLECAAACEAEPLEYLIDRLVGASPGKAYTSPYQRYYFSKARFENERGEYIAFLSALRLLRDKLRDYRRRETVWLRDFIELIRLHSENEMPIVDETPFVSDKEAVSVMTAHKAKGLEFDAVFVLNCTETVWTATAGRRQISFPDNLPIAPPGDAFDDQLRLFYVALTRAKSKLYLSAYSHNEKGKQALPVPFIDHSRFLSTGIGRPATEQALVNSWQSYHPLPRPGDTAAVLKPLLADYQLNVTHLIKFLDVSRAGPQTFLLESLLKFPQSQTPAAAYGTAIHEALREAYRSVQAQKRLSPADILDIFEGLLKQQRLKPDEEVKNLARGRQELGAFLAARYDSFAPEHLAEVGFKRQGSAVGEARLSGQIDKVVVDKETKTAQVCDFKTGKPLSSWNSRSGNDGLKAWRYRTQLIFYKLLLENSRSWSDFRVEEGLLEFIQPVKGEIKLLEYRIEEPEADRMSKLIQAVWWRIQSLDFPEVSAYSKDITGIKRFEDDLIAGKRGAGQDGS